MAEVLAKLKSDWVAINDEIAMRSRKKWNGLRWDSRFESGRSKRVSLNVGESWG